MAKSKNQDGGFFAVTVSVPLRGKYRGEVSLMRLLKSMRLIVVSVPLRGKYRGEESVNSILNYIILVNCFRPLAG